MTQTKTTRNTSSAKSTKKPTRKGSTHKKKGGAGEELGSREAVLWTLGLLLLVSAVVTTISIVSHMVKGFTGVDTNWMGDFGVAVAQLLIEDGFGVGALVLPVLCLVLCMRTFSIGHIRAWKWTINCLFLMVWLSVAGSYVQHLQETVSFFHFGGMHGDVAIQWLNARVGMAGIFLILAILAGAYILYLSGETVRHIRNAIKAAQRGAQKAAEKASNIKLSLPSKSEGEYDKDEQSDSGEEEETDGETDEYQPESGDDTATTIIFDAPEEEGNPDDVPPFAKDGDDDVEMEVSQGEDEQPAQEDEPQQETAATNDRLTVGREHQPAETDEDGALEPYDPKLDLEFYHYPTIDLLNKYDNGNVAVDMDEQRRNRDQIKSTLASFGVEISGIKATVGPTVTLYEITLAMGVRISKVRSLEDDIAMSLSALGIRIIAPMPGKGTVGIEIPNKKPQIVSMESLINSRKFQTTDYELPIALGKTITNEIFMVDLAKLPHLLVAGATGQGKSVGLNAIITSLLYHKHPAELKFVMVDPKKVELSLYNPLVNHFLAQVEGSEDDEPIITDVSKVVETLKSLCQEMDARYDLLKKAKAKNIKEYNAKFRERQLSPKNGHKFLPYIVVVIDEFGDFIMTAGKEVELPIARIAQLARAVGIHMIIATQRPAANVITGNIRTNFPARMAFKVSSATDSRIALDKTGANRLVGKGDMLFLAGNEPVRVQCAFVDTPEVERICAFIAKQQGYTGPMLLPPVASEESEGGAADVDLSKLDPLFNEVAEFVVLNQTGSTSTIQRKWSIGYNRAGRLMDQLEKAGIVGPIRGSKPREVLCMSIDELNMKMNGLR